MKANEAPEKLYIDFRDRTESTWRCAYTEKQNVNDIEYVRTDAFIDKAAKWLEDNAIEYWGTEAVDNGMMIVEFKKTMRL